MKKILRDLSFWLAAVLTLILVITLWLPKLLGFGAYYISTPSMEPAIPRGSLAFTKHVEIGDIVPGEDVLAFRSDPHKKTFIHRCTAVDLDKGLVYTKGDANEVDDPLPADFSHCYGKVVFHIPLIGWLSFAVDTLAGKIVIAALYALWLAIELERKRSKKSTKDVRA